jgi:hypothetical protein
MICMISMCHWGAECGSVEKLVTVDAAPSYLQFGYQVRRIPSSSPELCFFFFSFSIDEYGENKVSEA